MSERRFPTIYELDDDNESTGTVYHFCRPRCMLNYVMAMHEPDNYTMGEDGEAEVDTHEVCAFCGALFYPQSIGGWV